MKFWGSSALLPLIFRGAASGGAANLLRDDSDIAVWRGTWVERAVAISRQERQRGFDDETEKSARARLDRLADGWYEIEPTDDLRLLAMIVFRDHRLKAADCLQLASALRWGGGDTTDAEFACLDDQLRRTAQDERCGVLPGAFRSE